MNEKAKVSTTLKWKAEVTFEGTMKEFNDFKTTLVKYPIEVAVSEFGKFLDPSTAGYMRVNYGVAFQEGQLEKLIEGAPRMEFKRIRGFAGGIRTPHLHLGNEVVLVDKERFKTILGEVARNIFELRVETEDDFCDMIKPLAVG